MASKKNILVVGSGGREHALCWKFAQSPRVEKVYCAPGNAGIAQDATCVDISASDLKGLLDFAKENSIDITIVGPEAPLADGIVDLFESEGLVCFGPTKDAAQIEASKVFTKDLLQKYKIPTGKYKVFEDPEEAKEFVRKETGVPVVIKADGLAAGKGVILCFDLQEAFDAIDEVLVKKAFGDAGNRLIVEEFLYGEEASFMAITDGKDVLPLATSQDHKAVFDNDKGPNTGGMGAYSPAPVVNKKLFKRIMKDIMIPTVEAMEAEGHPYKGVLYGGLIIKDGKAKVLEFNCRFGDPEAQPILMRLKTDLLDVVEAAIEGRLKDLELEWDDRAAVCVVLASGGYPGKYEKGKVIHGLEEVEKMKDVMVFHAGTALKDGKFVTAGGRVLGVTALGDTIKEAIDRAYEAVSKISWEGMHYRKDIGQKALKHLSAPKVSIVMGSKSDLKVMEKAAEVLDDFGVTYEVKVLSAHRTPALTAEFASNARELGTKVIIAGAGMAAHLAGVIASHTTLPVIGVPIDSGPLKGLDALLATVQMPPGIPVATVGIGKAGAKNAALLAIEILAIEDDELKERLASFRREQEEQIKSINEKGVM
ncbi:MAG: phosphoribosylamine--glycine ligase [Thermodesulfobacteria bacterium]|nr:phosphoribosylamine--glycine ligase [Thermodesulfobacteriota bacterium]